ncbi:hypothetical protein SBADM41S_01617 [Streptomyces badius]
MPWPMRLGPEPRMITAAWCGLPPRSPRRRRSRSTASSRRTRRRRCPVQELESLDDLVVQADVGDLGAAERGVGDLVERGVDGEAVVVRGDLDLAGGAVLHRLVDAAVAVLQLVGAEAERAAEDLVAEADAEERGGALQHAAHQGDRVVGGGRVAGAVGEEDAVGLDRVHLFQGGGGGQDVHLDAALGHPVRGHALDAEVDRGDGELLRADRGDDVRLLRRHFGGEVGAGHLGGLADPARRVPSSGIASPAKIPARPSPRARAGAG